MKHDMTFGGHVGPGLEMDGPTYGCVCKRVDAGWWRSMAVGVAVIAVACGVGTLLLLLFLRAINVADAARTYIVAGLACVISSVVGWFFFYRVQRRRVRRVLRECGFAVCEPCGYVMTGLPPGQVACPECGRESATVVGDRST